MKVLLLDDVYNLGRAGDVKKVANGYGRNYLIPQGLAVLATPGALKEVEHIRKRAVARRAALNEEMSAVAEQLDGVVLTYPMKAGETGKLYGSVTTQMISESLFEEAAVTIDRRNVDSQPIRTIGEHKVAVRLTMDLIPDITVIVHREGESPESIYEISEDLTAEGADVDDETPEMAADVETELTAEVEAADTLEELEPIAADEVEPSEAVEASVAEPIAEIEPAEIVDELAIESAAEVEQDAEDLGEDVLEPEDAPSEEE